MKASCRPAARAFGIEKGTPHPRQAATPDRGADQPAARPERMTKHECSNCWILRMIEDPNCDDDICALRLERLQRKMIDRVRDGLQECGLSPAKFSDNDQAPNRPAQML